VHAADAGDQNLYPVPIHAVLLLLYKIDNWLYFKACGGC
jgi:hypothetical protein